MPQLTNITIGAAVSLPATDNALFRVVPQSSGARSRAFEHSVVGSPELASKISADTRRVNDGSQSSMIRVTLPILREVDGLQTRVDANITEFTCKFAKVSSAAEREAVISTLIRALRHQFFIDVLVNGEDMT